jgi:DNA-binding winged helix-turn-helix (wHTH) protein
VTFRFAGFALDTDARLLLADEREIHLSPKAFELLSILIEHRARALSKSELQQRLWPTTFVGDANLPTLAAEIRRALGDTARGSKLVRTVHRFGYRFVGLVVAEPAGAPAGPEGGVRMYIRSADRDFVLRQGDAVIGRAADAAIRIDSGGVSRHHARIVVHGDEARVTDLASKNGTFVQGARVTGECLLEDGDEIRVGPVVLTFKIAPATQATETIA